LALRNLVIPVILSITILVAGIFAFSPIEKATTIDSTVPQNVADLVDAVADLEDNSLSQILTLGKKSPPLIQIITATSSSEFIITVCGNNDNPTNPDILDVVNDGFLLVSFIIDSNGGGQCATTGGLANETLEVSATAFDGVTFLSVVMQTRGSATASLT